VSAAEAGPARQHRGCTPSRQGRREIRIRAFGWKTQQLHLIMDNYAAHKHPKVRAWLAANPRIHIHFTPTSGSWLNLVEVWFGIIERQAIHRARFPPSETS
jgi:transposase